MKNAAFEGADGVDPGFEEHSAGGDVLGQVLGAPAAAKNDG